ncbi:MULTISPECIES: DUF6230 family protein [unclassified Geobacillus]|uniref:DUF6230 family protein n=1 Tax=unclassified Geobacillus TaxID=2642459 RepID=UPI000BE27D8B|nr:MULTISPECIES: DUF6230 family protein [unclassified Geobacillus]PDM39132.1 hypothetical protein CN643_00385 [Parageobacillus yumthangensis]RDV23761.1 hypothetical protein DXK91_00680 [Parageobacillus toebii]TXK90787.1 hypothetical protein FVE24_09640 [Parageobacillus sp. SY1]PUF87705.1 hypothetical protein DCC82_00390 [Geobacillus sp. LYN3]TXK86342.1 hypothetical protein FVE68_15035 [Geobacillus sp. AYS3]
MDLASKTVIIGGHTAKKPLMIALLSGFLFLGMLLSLFGLTGMAYAVPLSGFGEFTVKFDKMVGTGFNLYGGVADGAEKQNVPVAVNELQHATINGLEISKDIPLLGIRVVITSDQPVEIDGLVQKATLINGSATFTNLTMKENYVGNIKDPAEKAAKEFTQNANQIVIKNGDLKTLYLFQKTVTLPGMKVYFEKIN